MAKTRLRVFEYFIAGKKDPLWVASPDRKAADAAAMKKGWPESSGHEIFKDYVCLPTDRPGLKQFGCDVVIGL